MSNETKFLTHRTEDEPIMKWPCAQLGLIQDENSGELDLVLTCNGSSSIIAKLSESRNGWIATHNGLYLSYGPLRNIHAAIKAVFSDDSVMRYLIAELCGDEHENEDTNTCIEIRHG